ncbi:MAG TPA: class I SAM-dependent methyltransferase [Methanocorpusculum sp.]|nr:class I SAM-dependent methyltransferase [Methanocorpusculum sp.]
MRISGDRIHLDAEKISTFFSTRATKYDSGNPYVSVLFQDRNPELAEKWNVKEKDLILPLLKLNFNSRILDVACGIGRWVDNLNNTYAYYLGIDSTDELIAIASLRYHNKMNTDFITISAEEFPEYFSDRNLKKFNRIIVSGLFQYLNDENLHEFLQSLLLITDDDSILYFLTAVCNTGKRLTLQNIYSEELSDIYNAIYRTPEEYLELFDKFFGEKYKVRWNEDVFKSDEKIHTRDETSQHC